jgi:hypothetical protein
MNCRDTQCLFLKKVIVPLVLLALAVDGTAECPGQEYRSDYPMTEPVSLTPGPGNNEDPYLLRAKDGTIYMTWYSDRGGHPDIYLNASRDGKKWGEPVAVIQGHDAANFYPSLAQTSDGTFHLTWFRINAKCHVFSVWYSNSKDAKTWSEPRPMTPPDKGYNWVPTMAAGNNSLWLAWASGRTGNKDVFVMQSKASGRTWQEPVQVTSHPFHDDLPNIAQKPDGTLIIVWTRYKPGKSDYLSDTADIYYTTSKDGRTWGDPVAITKNDYTDTIPEIYCNMDRSEFFMAWCSPKGSLDLPLSNVKAQPMHLLGGTAGGYSLRLLPLTDKDYLVVWVRKIKNGAHIYSCQIRKRR